MDVWCLHHKSKMRNLLEKIQIAHSCDKNILSFFAYFSRYYQEDLFLCIRSSEGVRNFFEWTKDGVFRKLG